MSILLIYAVLIIWFALVIELNGSILFGINFEGTTGLLYWTGIIVILCAIFIGINAGIREKKIQEFQEFKGVGKIEK